LRVCRAGMLERGLLGYVEQIDAALKEKK
jgi:hypothetical protein